MVETINMAITFLMNSKILIKKNKKKKQVKIF